MGILFKLKVKSHQFHLPDRIFAELLHDFPRLLVAAQHSFGDWGKYSIFICVSCNTEEEVYFIPRNGRELKEEFTTMIQKNLAASVIFRFKILQAELLKRFLDQIRDRCRLRDRHYTERLRHL